VFDPGAIRSGLGDLLVATHERTDDTHPPEDEARYIASASSEHLHPSGAGLGTTVSGAVPRHDGIDFSIGSGAGGGTGASRDEGRAAPIRVEHPGSLEGGQCAFGPMIRADSSGDGTDGKDALGAVPTGADRSVIPVFPAGRLGGGRTEPGDRTSVASPYAVDLNGSAVAATAFGPVLSGPGASGPGGPSGAPASLEERDQAPLSRNAWPGHPGSGVADQAEGPSLELSKTNELLQQLLDEVRKGRQPFLPPGSRNASF
jgi:hypothetical protein